MFQVNTFTWCVFLCDLPVSDRSCFQGHSWRECVISPSLPSIAEYCPIVWIGHLLLPTHELTGVWVISLWLFRMLLLTLCADFCMHMYFHFSCGMYLGVELPYIVAKLRWDLQTVFQAIHPFTFSPAAYDGRTFCSSLLTLAPLCLYYKHSSEAASHCGFDIFSW